MLSQGVVYYIFYGISVTISPELINSIALRVAHTRCSGPTSFNSTIVQAFLVDVRVVLGPT